MNEKDYLDGAPIYQKSVTHTVVEGADNEVERSYSVTSYSDQDDTAYIETENYSLEIPKGDIPLLINALTDFIK